MPDIVITPNRGTTNNPKIDFTGTSAGTIKLEVLGDGTIAWNGANGSLFSISDSLSGSLMSVNDISGLPAFEVFSDNRVVVGQFGANLLLGTTTNSSNGRLQLATHTSVAGGIGFGTDIGLYRLASNKLSFRGTANAEMSLRFERTGGSFTTTWENYIPVGSTDLKWFNGADKFTLTASGNATFSGYVVGTSGFAASGIYNYAFLQTTDSNNFWITPGNNQWGLYFETSAGGLLGGTGDSNRLGFVGNATARFYVDLNNGNGWFGGTATATQLISNVAQGTAPLVVTSTTQVSNLNAQYLNGYSSDTANTANTIVRRDGSGNFSAGTITATLAGLATSETLSTVTGRGATTASQISVNTSAGGSMLTGTKAGGTYGDGVSGATFKSILDNANGGAAFAFSSYYGGSGGTLGASIRADGYAYFKEDVGIGTNSPSGKLDVRVAGTGTWDRFIVTTTSLWGDGSTQYVTIGGGGASGIMLSNPHVVWNSGNSAAGIRMGRSGGISSGAWYEVGTGTSDSFHIKKESTTRLHIDTNGNVGIGTTSPVANLHIYRGVNSTVATLGEVASYSTVKIGRFRADQDHSLYIGNAGSYASFLQGANDAGSNAMHILINPFGGNVGIGNTNPTKKLKIGSGTTTTVLGDDGIILDLGVGGQITSISSTNVQAGIATSTSFGYMGTWSNHPLYIRTNNSDRIIIESGGNVGIGLTSNIRGILHVNGSNYSESPTVNKLITVSDSANSDRYMILGYHSSPDCGVIQGLHQSTAWKPVSINPNGANVGIGTASPSYKLDVNGDVRVTGTLIVQDGVASTNIFGLTTFTKSLTITTSWIDVGISGSDLATGSYIIQVFVDNYNVSGGQYSEYYTGFMSWTSGATNSTDVDEIVLHKAGHAPNGNWINLRTVRQASSILKLQIIASGNTSGASNYVFKFRRMI